MRLKAIKMLLNEQTRRRCASPPKHSKIMQFHVLYTLVVSGFR